MSKLMSLLLLTLCIFANLAYAEREAPEQKISKMGAIFTLDLSHPELGIAYKDPSGLIWGDLVIENNRVLQVAYEDAKNYCEGIGARLPTNKEYLQLGKYLGAGTWTGYSVTTKDGEHSILFALDRFWYWSSTPYWFQRKKFQYIYWGDSGITEDGIRTSKGGAIHCVTRS